MKRILLFLFCSAVLSAQSTVPLVDGSPTVGNCVKFGPGPNNSAHLVDGGGACVTADVSGNVNLLGALTVLGSGTFGIGGTGFLIFPSAAGTPTVFQNGVAYGGGFITLPDPQGGTLRLSANGVTLTSAYTNATTTFSSVALQFPVLPSVNYSITCNILWQGSANTAGPKFQWTGPASPTAVAASAHMPVTASTYLDAAATAFSSAMADTGTITATTNFLSTLTLGLVNGVNAGTVTLQAAANGAGTLTIQPGSFCVMQ